MDSLPDRRLTEEEVEQLRESGSFEDVHIQGRMLSPFAGEVEAIVLTLPSGEKKTLFYSEADGWEVQPDIESKKGDK